MRLIISSRAVPPLAFSALLLAIWQMIGAMGWLPAYLLSPLEIGQAVIQYGADGTLLSAMMPSLYRAALGFTIGAGEGVVLGLLAGTWKTLETLVDPLVSLTYPLPKIAFFPIIAVFLGYTDLTRIIVIALVTAYPAFVNALSGTKGINSHFIWVAQNLEASRWRTFWQVAFPAALQRTLVGVRISLALTFVMLFATEVIASRAGLGYLIFQGYLNVEYGLMYAAIATLAVLGFAADRLLAFVGRRATRGQEIQAVGVGG